MTPGLDDFTIRELSVLSGMHKALPRAVIARSLGIAERTVKAHINRMYLRLGISEADGHRQLILMARTMNDPVMPSQPEEENLRHLFAPKELTILDLVCAGLKSRQVAERLGETESVVKNYLRVIFDKAGVGSRAELFVWWRTHARRTDAVRPHEDGEARSGQRLARRRIRKEFSGARRLVGVAAPGEHGGSL